MAEFSVKLPCITLESGHRALFIHAKVPYQGALHADVYLFRDDGQQIGMQMPVGRAMAFFKNGPFVNLREVSSGESSQQRGHIVDVNGTPISG